MIEALFSQLTFWHWLVLGVVLMVLEIFAPGLVFIWLGIAGLIMGGLLAAMPHLLWEQQILIFSGLSLLTVIIGRKLLKLGPMETDHPTLNRRNAQYLGREFTLETPIVNGLGRIHVDDTMWRITGPNLEAGTRVRVIAADGVLLNVEPVSPDEG
ncbi:NfeD family protein [Magnetospira thiophila]